MFQLPYCMALGTEALPDTQEYMKTDRDRAHDAGLEKCCGKGRGSMAKQLSVKRPS